jgi:hypothetical protein
VTTVFEGVEMNDRFVVLTGHLNNYPLPDLIGILRHQRKSGRLLIEFSKGPATFFFQKGELIDARMNELTGLQAIVVAMAQPEAPFNFNPLIQSSRRSIEPSFQRVVSEMLGCWDESALQVEAMPVVREVAPRPEPLALPPAPRTFVHERSAFLIAAVLIGVGLSTVIAVTGGFKSADAPEVVAAATAPAAPVTASQPATPPPATTKPGRVPSVSKKKTTEKTDSEPAVSEPSAPAIKVVMQVENGRVLKASIANPKPGMESYEALALRIARQRRYASTVSGGETVTISVAKER